MTPEQSRKFNTAFGGLFIGAGVLAWMLAIYFAVAPNEPAPAPVMVSSSIDLGSCRNTLAELGYTATMQDGSVTAYEPLTTDPQAQLNRATVAALVCKIPMKSFCMGEGCEQPGLTLVLRKPMDRASAEKALADAKPAPTKAEADKKATKKADKKG